MRLLFKQRFLSWFDSYDIYDEEGRTALEGWLKEADAAFAEKKEAGELEEKLRI